MVFISLDTVRADYLGCYGHPRVRTPVIDGLAAGGARFARAISHIPETALSHYAILSSIEPALHDDVNRHGASRYLGPLAQEIFKSRGYATAAVIGGVTLQAASTGLQRGFDLYDDHYAFAPDRLKRPGEEVTGEALRFIQQHAQSPFFLFVHYFDAHFPYDPPAPFDIAYDAGYKGQIDGSDARLAPYRDGKQAIQPRDLEHVKALYAGEVSALDALVGRLMDGLEKARITDRTLVVLFSDHGESFSHGYLFNHAGVLYDSTLHIPLIMRLPGRIRPGTVIEPQVRGIDVLPTVLDLVGIARDRKFQGASLWPMLRGVAQKVPAAVSTTDPWREGRLRAIREAGWKLIVGPKGRELFEVARDRDEARNLAGKKHPREAALSEGLERHQKAEQALAPQVQGPPLAPRAMPSPEQMRQLESLGYVQPK